MSPTVTPFDEVHFLDGIVAALADVPGLRAIALGGSRVRGEGHADSDYDIGLYDEGGAGLAVVALTGVAAALDDRGAAVSVTPPGGWGRGSMAAAGSRSAAARPICSTAMSRVSPR